MIPPRHSVLLLAGVLFALSVAGIFLNRKNVILLLMCIELMLLAVNFNFVAFARAAGRPRRPGVRVLHHDGRGGGVGHRPCHPGRAVPRAAEHQRRSSWTRMKGLEPCADIDQRAKTASTLIAHRCSIVLAPLLAAIVAGLGGRVIGRVGAHCVTIARRRAVVRAVARACCKQSARRRADLQRAACTRGWSATASAWRSASSSTA